VRARTHWKRQMFRSGMHMEADAAEGKQQPAERVLGNTLETAQTQQPRVTAGGGRRLQQPRGAAG
jgi:hypothetical protein